MPPPEFPEGLPDPFLAPAGLLEAYGIVARAARRLEGSGGRLYLCNPARQGVRCEYSYGEPPLDCAGVLKYGQGAAGRVALTGEPLLVEDYSAWAGRMRGEEAAGMHPVLSVPLLRQEVVTGVLQVFKMEQGANFTTHDLEILALFADQAALALENARLIEADHTARQQARTLQEVSALLTQQLGLEEVLENILNLVGRVVQYDSISIQLINAHQQLELVAGRGFDDLELARQVAREISQETMELRWQEKRVLVLPDTYADSRWVVTPESSHIRSWVGAPLLVKGRFIGCLNVDSRQPNAYDEATGETIMAFANQAAIALENARLFETERTAHLRAEALRDAARIVSSSLSLEQVLSSVMDQLARVLPYDTSTVMLIEGGRARLRAWRGYEAFCGQQDFDAISFDIHAEKASQTFGQVARSGIPLVIADTREDQRWLPTPISGHVLSWLGVPITARGKTVGLFSIDRVQAGGFSEEEIALAQAFAVHASAAIENARLYEAEGQRAAELEAVRQASLSLTTRLNLRQVLDAILWAALNLLPQASNIHIYLYSQEGHEVLTFGAAIWADGPKKENVSTPRPNGLTYSVAHSGETIAIPDIHTHALYAGTDYTSWVGAIIGLPLKIGQRVVGVMNVAYRQPREFTESELRILRLLGDQAAVAIENARLFEQAATERRHLRLLYDIGRELSTSLDADQILSRALTLTCEALEGLVGQAFLYLPEEERLALRALYGRPDVSVSAIDQAVKLSVGEGLAGWVAEKRMAASIPDVRQDKRWRFVPGVDDDVRSAISAPIRIGERLLGVLSVLHRQPSSFTNHHLTLMEAICQEVGLALLNASRYQQVQRRLAELTLIQDLAETFSKRLELQVLLDEVASQLSKRLGYPQVEIFLMAGNDLHLRALKGRMTPASSLPVSSGIVGRVARTGKSAFIPDVTTDPDYETGLEGSLAELAVPIFLGQRVVGVINIETDQPEHLSLSDHDLLLVLASQISVAFENASLYERVRQHAEELENLVEHMPTGVLLLDAAFNLLASNPAGREILLALNGFVPAGFVDTIGTFPIDRLVERHQDPLPVEIRSDDEAAPRIFEAQARPIGEECTQWVISVREVTQERQNQARIQSQERLATVGQLAAGIAHDFNNIMAAILVYTDLLRNDPNQPAAGRDKLGIIQEQVQRAASLIRQILDFSRRSVMEQITLDLLPFVKELDRLLGRVLPETIRLELTYQPGEYWVTADPTRLQQVFMNLALNARDAMPEGGAMRFGLRRRKVLPGERLSFGEIPAGEWIEISVSDTGTGISPEARQHIFEPFFTTKPAGVGTGLGLAQVYGIIKQHGGYIDVWSQVGFGTSFSIFLADARAASRPAKVSEAQETAGGQGEAILVVEDDRATREAIQALLQAHNYRVQTADDGAQALELCHANQGAFDLVISDVVMPKMGGLALYNALKANWPAMKVLFITGHPMDSQNQELLETSDVSWLQKPFAVPDFNRLVRSLIR